MNIKEKIEAQAQKANLAAAKLAVLSSQEKNGALMSMATALETGQGEILAANREDVSIAKERGQRSSYIDRLTLNEKRIAQMAEGLRATAALPDPIGQTDYGVRRPNGMEIRRVRVPLGVIGIIYEARPNVTADAAALCLKAGNAVILRGGSEAIRSNTVISRLLAEAAYKNGIPEGALQFVEVTEREAVDVMLKLKKLAVIIPRGGAGLIRHVTENSLVPVIETGTGVCHTYVDETADLDMAIKIAVNAKTSHPSVCNAMETLLVHEKIAPKFLPLLEKAMGSKSVELRGCPHCRMICPNMKAADELDWSTEYGDLILAVRAVTGLDEAISHINRYNTGHSETIVTQNLVSARRFQREVDAAAVYVNVSTRFTDGFEFGFGAEIGISTQKLHARGPMGLMELTSVKYLIDGNGQIRE